MARVTVEDCVDKIRNRFRLVMLASQRARELSVGKGEEITLDRDNDKNPVVALREIAEETISLTELEEELIHGLQRHGDTDDPEEEAEELLAMEEEFAEAADAEAAMIAESIKQAAIENQTDSVLDKPKSKDK